MSWMGILFLAVLVGAGLGFLVLLDWAERLTRK